MQSILLKQILWIWEFQPGICRQVESHMFYRGSWNMQVEFKLSKQKWALLLLLGCFYMVFFQNGRTFSWKTKSNRERHARIAHKSRCFELPIEMVRQYRNTKETKMSKRRTLKTIVKGFTRPHYHNQDIFGGWMSAFALKKEGGFPPLL